MFVRSNSIDNVDILLAWTLSLEFELQPHNCVCEFQVIRGVRGPVWIGFETKTHSIQR